MCIKHCLTLKNLPGALSNPQVDGELRALAALQLLRCFLRASDEAPSTPAMTGNGEDTTYKMTYKKWWYPVMTYKNGDDLGLITFPKSSLIVASTCN